MSQNSELDITSGLTEVLTPRKFRPREDFLQEKIWENPARIFCLSPVMSSER